MLSNAALNLNQFIGRDQLSVMQMNCNGEEGAYFKTMIEHLKNKIATMPKTYETDGQGDDAMVSLHYFKNGSDWYIVERDAGSSDDEVQGVQAQAFGFACLNGDYENAELGYISITELIRLGVELDLYYKPERIGDVKARYESKADMLSISINYYLLIVRGDIEPEVQGPFASSEERDRKALEIRFNTPDGDEAGIFPLEIKSERIPDAIEVGSYSGGYFEENNPMEAARP